MAGTVTAVLLFAGYIMAPGLNATGWSTMRIDCTADDGSADDDMHTSPGKDMSVLRSRYRHSPGRPNDIASRVLASGWRWPWRHWSEDRQNYRRTEA